MIWKKSWCPGKNKCFTLETMAAFTSDSWFWWSFAINCFIGSAIIFILLICHSISLILDFFTKNRKSVQWRSEAPRIDRLYIWIAITSYLAILLFCANGIIITLSGLRIWNEYGDKIAVIPPTFYMTAKQFMYFTFTLRLYIVYKDSMYYYSPKALIPVVIISMITTAITIGSVHLLAEINIIYYKDIPFAMHCDVHYELITLGVVALGETIVQSCYLYMFLNPIRLIIKRMDKGNGGTSLKFIGVKCLITSFVAMISTTLLMLSLNLIKSNYFVPMDMVINCICIMMMTPYYDDNKYYKKICCLLIKLMDKFVIWSENKTRSNRSISLDHHVQKESNFKQTFSVS